MPRARYRRVSEEDRQRIVDAFRDGADYVACAAQLGVRRGTAYSIIRRSQITGTAAAAAHAGGRPPKMDAEMRDFCMLLIEELPTITLREINRLMRTTWPNKPVVNEATISRALSGMLISVKLVHDVPVNRNWPDIIQQRKR